MLANFRGSKAHDFEWLKKQYAECGAPPFPSRVSLAFIRVNTWGSEMRYRPGAAKQADAEAFLKAVEEITTWADERM